MRLTEGVGSPTLGPMLPAHRSMLLTALLALVLLAAGCQASPTPTPTRVPGSVSLSVSVPVDDAAVVEAAQGVLIARLTMLGMTDITPTLDPAGTTLTFTGTVPATFDLEVADAALRHGGVVDFVPWPADEPPPGPGDPVPSGLAPLFDGATGIAGAELVTDGDGQRLIDIHLQQAGSEAIGAYTAEHVGEALPLVLDGRVLAAPTISGPITGDVIRISVPSGDPISLELLAALLSSGPLPAAWIGLG